MVIAQRTLYISRPDGDLPVTVDIHAPHEVEAYHWACDYEIGWPEGKRIYAGHGVDSVQALWIAMQMIGIELYTNEHHKAGRLYSERQKGGYGFPIAANCRDLLVGDDRHDA